MSTSIETRTVTFATREGSRLDRRGYDHVTVTFEVVAYDHGFTARVDATIVADGLAVKRPLKSTREVAAYDVTNYDLLNDYKALWAWVDAVISAETANIRRTVNR